MTRMARRMVMLVGGVVVAVTFGLGLLAAGATGRPAALGHGQAGPFAWTIGAHAERVGHPPRPGFCVDVDVRANGRRTSTGASLCFNRGDPRANGNKGVINGGFGESTQRSSVNAILELVDPRAARVVITLHSGRVLRAPTHALPPRLHAGARLAWVVLTGKQNALKARREDVRRVVAYDASGHVVGSF